jgi:hypothetical protein
MSPDTLRHAVCSITSSRPPALAYSAITSASKCTFILVADSLQVMRRVRTRSLCSRSYGDGRVVGKRSRAKYTERANGISKSSYVIAPLLYLF